MQQIEFETRFRAPVSEIFGAISDHENFGRMTGAKMTRIQEGDDGKVNGVGSVRRVKIGPLPAFEETVVEFKSNKLITYTITKGSPLKEHLGCIRFKKEGDETVVHYTIEFKSRIPLAGPFIKIALQTGIQRGLKKHARLLEKRAEKAAAASSS